MEAFEILIIMLSVTLIVFLVALTVLIIMGIKLINSVKRAAETAEGVAESVKEFAERMRAASNVGAYGSAVMQFLKTLKKGRK